MCDHVGIHPVRVAIHVCCLGDHLHRVAVQRVVVGLHPRYVGLHDAYVAVHSVRLET